MIFLLVNSGFSQGPLQLIRLEVNSVSPTLMSIRIDVRNNGNLKVEKLAGYVDFIDHNGKVYNKEFVILHHAYEPPMETGSTAGREIIFQKDENFGGSLKFRITHIKFVGDEETYIQSPKCGEIISRD
jgi:hypothetical protein